ncbi:MAG: hypothetical protein ACRDQ4_21695 [Pseudonocardiaceae bacterium]
MVTVERWTGAETKALRQAMRLSIRAFAAHLGVDARTVNKWEARGATITLLPDTQALMDTALSRAPDDVKTRFTQTLNSSGQQQPTNPTEREVNEALSRSGAVPTDPQDRERVALATRHPRRVDAATVSALAVVLAATRRLEDQLGSAAVLPGIRDIRALVHSLLADARSPIRDRVGALAGELHQYLGWLLAETGHTDQARAELDAALALGVEIDDPDLTSLALSFKGHLAWMLDDSQEVIALSRAARHDGRVFVAQHAYNAYQEARGWAMAGEPAEVDRILGHADKLAERAVARQADTPPNLYWYGPAFFTLQRGLTWHTLGDARFAERAVAELTKGLHELPDTERDSEWAAIFTVAAAEALTTAGDAERAIEQARHALTVCCATRSTRLAHVLRRAHTQMRDTWPTHAAVRDLGDEMRSLSDAHHT